ncbi:hypothetical protein [uncultured Aquimarina sp.]|uniref:hypothetical protein n=1 Tax=uncultured Aquimarina sp. TaxID=575652 RepID=UPI0026034419|nr:hypothetical protein [uncultured Aquimarina sp.]
MQKALYLIIFSLSFVGFSQDTDILRGKIITDTLHSKSINIINLTKGVGTINDSAGFFQIKATKGDTIVFSSVQHQQKTHVVTKKDLKEASLSIQLEIKVNELDEVTISKYDLTGESKEDVKKIKTYEDVLPLFNAKALDETPFIHEKGAATVRNTVIADEMDATPINFIAVGRMIASLFKKKDTGKSREIRIPEISDFYNGDFMVSELEIPKTEVYNFLDYINQQAETKNVLKSGNELIILEYLIGQSKIFNADKGLEIKD